MKPETRNCQSCKKDFVIEPDDFGFYEKIKVPPPVWCPECRMFRRMAWYGYRFLYKRTCDFTGEGVITGYHPDLPYKVYKQDIWWSDAWDPMDYGRDYDFSRPFFEQFKELMDAVPKPALHTEYTTMINSPYCNAASYQKNGYFCFKHITGEDTAYTNVALNTKNSLDLAYSADPELCYEVINVHRCYQTFFSEDCEDCRNVYFSRDLQGCSDCFGCSNLRNKNYYWFNEQLTKEEYKKRFDELDFGTVENVAEYRRATDDFFLQFPRRNFHGRNNVGTSGDYIYNSKNVRDAYFVSDTEDSRYVQLFIKGNVKNCYDITAFGSGSELMYECTWMGHATRNAKFGIWCYRNQDTEHTFASHGGHNVFGCVGLKKGEYCILNKQYTKEEYFSLVEKIKVHMEEMPFIDRIGRRHGYGGQIPIDLCPWAYNESTAQEFFPLTKEKALEQGFLWRDTDAREYKDASLVTPIHIQEVPDDFTKAILKCEGCGKNYQIIPLELQFLKRFGIRIPHECPLCRDRARIRRLSPMAIYERTCARCEKVIETSYAPERPEIVYCEECYKQEVI